MYLCIASLSIWHSSNVAYTSYVSSIKDSNPNVLANSIRAREYSSLMEHPTRPEVVLH